MAKKLPDKKNGAKKNGAAKRAARMAARAPRPPGPDGTDAGILDRLHTVVVNRQSADPTLSHSARLLARGTAKVAQKFGEESVECVIEAVAGNRPALIAESADVLYHLLVMWVSAGVAPGEVWAELARREGVSGIAEKAARPRALRLADAAKTRKVP